MQARLCLTVSIALMAVPAPGAFGETIFLRGISPHEEARQFLGGASISRAGGAIGAGTSFATGLIERR